MTRDPARLPPHHPPRPPRVACRRCAITAATLLTWAVAAEGCRGDGSHSPLSAVGTTLVSGTVGESYSRALEETPAGAAPFSYLLIDGQLPPGVSLDAATGVLGGTPNIAGTFSFRVRRTDAAQDVTETNYVLTIAPAP